MASPGRHALVFGASGITGWAIVNAILEGYPSKDAFDKVTALTNRPLAHQDSEWPSDSRLEIISGIDILKGDQSNLEELLKEKIPSVDTVSHVYFYGMRSRAAFGSSVSTDRH